MLVTITLKTSIVWMLISRCPYTGAHCAMYKHGNAIPMPKEALVYRGAACMHLWHAAAGQVSLQLHCT